MTVSICVNAYGLTVVLPRIHLEESSGVWLCHVIGHEGITGDGETPAEAYADWEMTMRMERLFSTPDYEALTEDVKRAAASQVEAWARSGYKCPWHPERRA